MIAAIENVTSMKFKKKLVIAGDMLELGESSIKEHKKIIDLLKEEELEAFLVGKIFNTINQDIFKTFLNVDELKLFLSEKTFDNTLILIKGSRGIKLENALDSL